MDLGPALRWIWVVQLSPLAGHASYWLDGKSGVGFGLLCLKPNWMYLTN